MPPTPPPLVSPRITPAIMWRYAMAGLVNTLVGLGIIAVLDFGLGIRPAVANAIGYAFGLVVAFTLNRHFVFRRAVNRLTAMRRFLAAFGVSFLLNQIVLAGLLRLLPHGPVAAATAQLGGIVTYTTVMFLLSAHWVFVDPRAAPPRGIAKT